MKHRIIPGWQGWRRELLMLAIAAFIVFGFDARWWWKAAVLVAFSVALAVIEGIIAGYRRGGAS